MIITLIALASLVIGIVLHIIYNNDCFYRWMIMRNVKNPARKDAILDIVSFAFMVFGITTTVIVSVAILCNVGNYDVDYQNAICEKEMLEYRIEHMEDNIVGNEMLYNDIVEFNNELGNEKKWANNPWTNWFANQDIATMDYVVLED